MNHNIRAAYHAAAITLLVIGGFAGIIVGVVRLLPGGTCP